jgi:AcrR family transcriptional regulator
MRADARRNVERVLKAAEELFADEGLSVPVDMIAARAGVGVGTLYRHFPTKEALFTAIVVAHLESLSARARDLAASEPGEAFFTFLREMGEMAARKRDLADILARAGLFTVETCPVKQQLQEQFETLLERAQAAGAVRPDVTGDDVTALLMGACLTGGEHGQPAADVMVSVICDGLRADHRR